MTYILFGGSATDYNWQKGRPLANYSTVEEARKKGTDLISRGSNIDWLVVFEAKDAYSVGGRVVMLGRRPKEKLKRKGCRDPDKIDRHLDALLRAAIAAIGARSAQQITPP
jgi:hypothetical protein